MEMDFEEDESLLNESEAHKHFAVNLYNLVWDLLEKPTRTQLEDELMVHAAHSSAFHWSQVGAPVNFQRSAWQLARVYTVLNDREKSLYYAKRCYNLTTEQNLVDFDLAFAFEAMARAAALNGLATEFHQFKSLAMQASEQIEDEDDKQVFLKDVQSGPWFGMEQ